MSMCFFICKSIILAIFPVPARPCNPGTPVGTGAMTAGMLAKSNVARYQRSSQHRELIGAQVFFAQQAVNSTCMHGSNKHSFGIDPLPFYLRRARTDKYRPWRT